MEMFFSVSGLLSAAKLNQTSQQTAYTNQLTRTNNTEMINIHHEVNGRSSPATHKLSRGGSGKKKEKCLLT